MKKINKIKTKIAEWFYNNLSYPKKELQKENFLWLFKDNCPYCIDKPLDSGLSNMAYIEKYPACNKLYVGGGVTISICDKHLIHLYAITRRMLEEKIEKGEIIVEEEQDDKSV